MLSPFYHNLYENIDIHSDWKLSDFPLVDQKLFWKSNTIQDNKLLTAEIIDGIVFKSGGTSGDPKFSVYTKMEWETMTTYFGQHFAQNGLQKGDKIANLFYVGELYSSFIFLSDTIERCPVDVAIFPISGSAPTDFIINT